LRDINISGGEPFLRPDLVDLIKLIVKNHPKARIIISSNGFATDLIKEKMARILKIKPNIGIGISLDGIGKAHEEVRRIPGAFEKAMATLKMLKEDLKMKNIRIAFTAGDYNINELEKVYQLANSMGIEFTAAAVHNADIYFNVAENKITKISEFKNQFGRLVNSELKFASPKRWARAYFAFALYKFIESKKRILPNYSGTDNIFIDPQGNVYPSDVSAHLMGNLKDFDSYEELVKTEPAQKAVEAEKYVQNWMVCTARSAIKRHILTVIFWIIKNKLFGARL
jgi:MoaA/NifB/PqqE/SkfB family radical SAM enzyme